MVSTVSGSNFVSLKNNKMKKLIYTLASAIVLMACSTDGKKSESTKTESSSVIELNSYVHAHGMPSKGKILMVASSPTVSKQTLANRILGC
jgi:hypothetical protein